MLLAQVTEAAKTLEYVGNSWGFAAFVVVLLIMGFFYSAHVWFRDVVKPESAARTNQGERLTQCVEVVTTDVAIIKENTRVNREAIERLERNLGDFACKAGT